MVSLVVTRRWYPCLSSRGRRGTVSAAEEDGVSLQHRQYQEYATHRCLTTALAHVCAHTHERTRSHTYMLVHTLAHTHVHMH